jgi:hypothetical protein
MYNYYKNQSPEWHHCHVMLEHDNYLIVISHMQ